MVVDELDVVDDVLLLETVDVVRLRSVRSRRDTIQRDHRGRTGRKKCLEFNQQKVVHWWYSRDRMKH